MLIQLTSLLINLAAVAFVEEGSLNTITLHFVSGEHRALSVEDTKVFRTVLQQMLNAAQPRQVVPVGINS